MSSSRITMPLVPLCTRCYINYLREFRWLHLSHSVPLLTLIVRRSRDAPISSKRQKKIAKRGRTSEEPARSYDHEKFVNESEAEKFYLISKNRSFIKEKGFHHPEDFFCKTIEDKGWRSLCQPPRPIATSVV